MLIDQAARAVGKGTTRIVAMFHPGLSDGTMTDWSGEFKARCYILKLGGDFWSDVDKWPHRYAVRRFDGTDRSMLENVDTIKEAVSIFREWRTEIAVEFAAHTLKL